MPIKGFLKLVEIQTKVASVFPFLIGTFYSIYRFGVFNIKNFLLMLVSLLSFDMATTAINNYFDFKRANKRSGYGYESHNGIVKYNIKESSVIAVILILLAVATSFGILLVLNTNYVVLILGMISFAVGILYSFGPVPVSRTPFGELFSGGFMGLLIPFIASYIHVFDVDIINAAMQGGTLMLKINVAEVIYIILLSMPAAVGIADIMLANNICDMDDDIENKRYTLPIYIGKDNSLKAFRVLYYVGYISLIILLIIKVAPPVCVLTLATFAIVNKHTKLFLDYQSKKDTFVLAVKNSVIINASLAVTLAIAVIIKYVM